MWLCVNGPSTLIGTYLGFKSPKLHVEAQPTRLARKKPVETTCMLNPVLCFFFCSVIPFSVIGAQFYYIFSSVSGGQNITVLYWSIYVSLIFLTILIAEVSIIYNYLALCYGSANRWWSTFMYGASIAAILFAAMTYRLLFRMTIYTPSTLGIYILIELMISVAVGLSCGSVATFATFVFNNVIFAKGRQD